MSKVCESCGKPLDTEAAVAQAAAMSPREVRESLAFVAKVDGLIAAYGKPMADVRLGDLVHVKLIAAAVPDIAAGFYCECDETAA